MYSFSWFAPIVCVLSDQTAMKLVKGLDYKTNKECLGSWGCLAWRNRGSNKEASLENFTIQVCMHSRKQGDPIKRDKNDIYLFARKSDFQENPFEKGSTVNASQHEDIFLILFSRHIVIEQISNCLFLQLCENPGPLLQGRKQKQVVLNQKTSFT